MCLWDVCHGKGGATRVMDAKISSEFWGDLGELPPDLKLCALWLMTTSRRKVCGYVETSERMFLFETGLPSEALGRTIEALPNTFRRVGKGVWIRNFIRRQIGAGKALAQNNWTKSLCREIETIGLDALRLMVAEEYPEIAHLLFSSPSSKSQALTKGLPSPREEKSRGEKSTERSAEEGRGSRGDAENAEGDGLNGPDGRGNTEPRREDLLEPLEFEPTKKKEAGDGALPLKEQMKRFAALFGRGLGKFWSYAEEQALTNCQPVTEGDLRLLEGRYGQPEEEGDPHRRRLLTLLQNLPGELDAARAALKKRAGGSVRQARKEPDPRWREIFEKNYRRPEDTEWRRPESFYDLPASLQQEVLAALREERKQ